MKIGILAVQGAFAEHKSKLEKLGARCVELRKKEDLDGDFECIGKSMICALPHPLFIKLHRCKHSCK